MQDDRRKIAANLMDLEGIVPVDNEHDNIDFARESNNKDTSFTWSRGRSIGSKVNQNEWTTVTTTSTKSVIFKINIDVGFKCKNAIYD